MSALTKRLARALERDGIVDKGDLDGCKIERTYAGRVQQSHGAWSFAIVTKSGADFCLGSQFAASVLVKAPRIGVESDGSLYPDREAPQ